MGSRNPEQLASISKSLELIALRAIQTGRGPDVVLASVSQRRAAGDSAQPWRLAREIAAELAPRLAGQLAARAESVLDRDTVAG